MKKKVNKIEFLRNKYKQIPDNLFKTLLSLDPSTKHKYSQWILNIYCKNKLKDEDFYKVTQYLTDFEKVKSKLKEKDINQYKSLPELFSAIDQIGGTGKVAKDENYLINDRYYINNNEATVFTEDDEYFIVIPKTLKASKFYASRSGWCTAYPEQFHYYNQVGHLYIIINKNKLNTKYHNRILQFHFQSGSFMDISDFPINIEQRKKFARYFVNKIEFKHVYKLITENSIIPQKHIKFIQKLFDNNEIKLKDIPLVERHLKLYLLNGHLLNIRLKQIETLNDLTCLETKLDDRIELVLNEKGLYKNRQYIDNGDAEVLYEDELYLAVSVFNYDAFYFYSINTNWVHEFQMDDYDRYIILINKARLNLGNQQRFLLFNLSNFTCVNASSEPLGRKTANEYLKIIQHKLNKYETAMFRYENIEYLNDSFFTVHLNNKCGIINKKYEEIIPVIYDSVENYNCDFFRVAINATWGLIDVSNQWVIEPYYDEIKTFHEGMAAVRKGELWGYINYKGEEVITPQYVSVQHFSEHKAGVMFYWMKNKRHVRSNCIKVGDLLDDLFDEIKEGKWGYIDKGGNIICPPLYQSVEPFKNGEARVIKFPDTFVLKDPACLFFL